MEGQHKRPAPDTIEGEAKQPRIEVQERAAALKQQIEYYLSDRNLRRDKFFHSKISSDPEGWLPVSLILGCKKIQALNASEEEILEALETSSLETRKDPTPAAIRRSEPLPPLASSETKGNALRSAPRTKHEIHHFGVLLEATNIPEEIAWAAIKTAVDAALLERKAESVKYNGNEVSRVRYGSNVTPAGCCYLYLRKFPNDMTIAESLKDIELNGQKIDISLVEDVQVATRVFSNLPPQIRRDREREYLENRRNLSKRGINIGGKQFQSIDHLRKCCKEVLETAIEDEHLGENAYPVISAVLDHHPRAIEKKRGMVAITVGSRTENGSTTKCFYLIREDGTRDDISLMKCLDMLSRNPPLTEKTADEQKNSETEKE